MGRAERRAAERKLVKKLSAKARAALEESYRRRMTTRPITRSADEQR